MVLYSLLRRNVVCLLLIFGTVAAEAQTPSTTSASTTWGPVLSQGWYSQNALELTELIDHWFLVANNTLQSEIDAASIKVIVMPHAGYQYSGFCGAAVVAQLLEQGKKNRHIKRVILLAPSHRIPFKGVALLSDVTHYKTVLGSIPLDKEAMQKLAQRAEQFKPFNEVFLKEHAVEIELPLLQKAIASFSLVPLIVGSITLKDCDAIIAGLREIIDDETLVVISTDFVHYGQSYGYQPFTTHIFNRIRALDSRIVTALVNQSRALFTRELRETGATVCGKEPLTLLLTLLEKGLFGKLESRLICYYTSPQSEWMWDKKSGNLKKSLLFKPLSDQDMTSSVSYVGLLFTGQKRELLALENRLTAYEKRALIATARATVKNEFCTSPKRLSDDELLPLKSEGLMQKMGAFVTLKDKKTGALRGCVGRTVASKSLVETVLEMSRAAAFHDSRFEPLKKEELKKVVFEVSLLTPLAHVATWKDIVVGKHGVVLEKNGKSAVFLPQVALEHKWDLPTMLTELSLKAGLPADAWKDGAIFYVQEGLVIEE